MDVQERAKEYSGGSVLALRGVLGYRPVMTL